MLTLLGTAEARLDGQRLLLNRRQTEVLALLALHPEGLSLEQLHAAVYGDQSVTLSTLKAEVSHLRSALGGQLASRPYRLTLPVAPTSTPSSGCCAAARWRPPSRRTAATCCRAPTPRRSPSYAEYVAVAVREALLADPEPDAVLRYSELAPYDTEVVEVCLPPSASSAHPAKPLLKGRLAAAQR